MVLELFRRLERLAVGVEELTNSSLTRRGRVFTRVGSGSRHTFDPASSLVKMTISDASDHLAIARN